MSGLAVSAIPIFIDTDRTLRVKVIDACGLTCTFCHNEGTPVTANACLHSATGTQAPDPTPTPPQNHGSRAGSTYPHPPCRICQGHAARNDGTSRDLEYGQPAG
jgi:hypothetical protein